MSGIDIFFENFSGGIRVIILQDNKHPVNEFVLSGTEALRDLEITGIGESEFYVVDKGEKFTIQVEDFTYDDLYGEVDLFGR